MCRRPVCSNGVNCGTGYAAAEVHRRAKRIPRFSGTSYRGNTPHKERIVVQVTEEVRYKLTYRTTIHKRNTDDNCAVHSSLLHSYKLGIYLTEKHSSSIVINNNFVSNEKGRLLHNVS